MSDRGAALFRGGYRIFFFAAGLWAAIAVPLWLLLFEGAASLPTALDFVAWHAHEMIFGYAAAVIAGFLLTAIPNWTGRLPLQARPLALLFALWLAGRLAVAASGTIGAPAATLIDMAFLLALFVVVLREIVAGRNRRNLPMPIALLLLVVGNGLTHFGAMQVTETGPLGERLGIAVVVMLIALVGGRVIPSFTRNWLAQRQAGRLPVPFNGFDKLCLLTVLAGLSAWVMAPDHPLTGILLLATGGLQMVRLARWQGLQTLAEPLVWSLHLGFLWVPVGLLLLGAGIFLPASLPSTAGLHVLTIGAIGGMTLAVMTRATLGHSGRPLTADRMTAAVYLLIALAAILRVSASISDDLYLPLLHAAGMAWFTCFVLFSIHFGKMHLSQP